MPNETNESEYLLLTHTLTRFVYMIRHDFHQNTSFDLMLIYGIAEDMGRHTRCYACRTVSRHMCTHTHCAPAGSIFFSSFTFSTWWLTRTLFHYKMISVARPSRGGHWEREITKCRLHHELVVHTCDLVVAYIHIHMLLMPGINNVLHFARTPSPASSHSTEWWRQKDTRKSGWAQPTLDTEVSGVVWEFVVFRVFLLASAAAPESATEVHLHNFAVLFLESNRDRNGESVAAVCLWYIKIAGKIPPKNTK